VCESKLPGVVVSARVELSGGSVPIVEVESALKKFSVQPSDCRRVNRQAKKLEL
jgi:hypothetical protein